MQNRKSRFRINVTEPEDKSPYTYSCCILTSFCENFFSFANTSVMLMSFVAVDVNFVNYFS